jgi:hypothetical protein
MVLRGAKKVFGTKGNRQDPRAIYNALSIYTNPRLIVLAK